MRIFAATVLALMCSVPTDAAPFTWSLEGDIPHLNPTATLPLGSTNPFTVGEPFAWLVTFESTSPDFSPNPTCGYYAPVTASQFTTATFSTGANLGSQYSLHTSTYTTPNDCLFLIPPGSDVGLLRVIYSDNWLLTLHFSGLYQTDALVTDVANFHPIAFDIAYFNLFNGVASGRVTSVTAVSEPVTPLLIGLGIAAAMRRRYRSEWSQSQISRPLTKRK